MNSVISQEYLTLFQTGPQIVGRKGTIFESYISLENYIILCILKGISPFKIHKVFSENLKKNLGFTG